MQAPRALLNLYKRMRGKFLTTKHRDFRSQALQEIEHPPTSPAYTCSHASKFCDVESCTKGGTAPLSTTARACSEVPDAMFVMAHAASYCMRAMQQLLTWARGVNVFTSASDLRFRDKVTADLFCISGYLAPVSKVQAYYQG